MSGSGKLESAALLAAAAVMALPMLAAALVGLLLAMACAVVFGLR